jgi:hypothetical protein
VRDDHRLVLILRRTLRRLSIPRADPDLNLSEVRTEKTISFLLKTYVPDPKLEAALENLRRAVGKAKGA